MLQDFKKDFFYKFDNQMESLKCVTSGVFFSLSEQKRNSSHCLQLKLNTLVL